MLINWYKNCKKKKTNNDFIPVGVVPEVSVRQEEVIQTAKVLQTCFYRWSMPWSIREAPPGDTTPLEHRRTTTPKTTAKILARPCLKLTTLPLQPCLSMCLWTWQWTWICTLGKKYNLLNSLTTEICNIKQFLTLKTIHF